MRLNTTLLILSGLFYLSSSLGQDNRTKIAIIDTGIQSGVLKEYLCKNGHKDVTGYGLNDKDGHGTNVAGLVASSLDPRKQCLVIIKWYHTDQTQEHRTQENVEQYLGNSLRAALRANVKYINMSLSGSAVYPLERWLIKVAVAKKIHVIVAAGNRGENLGRYCDAYPACYPIVSPYFHVVANYKENHRIPSSNWGGPVNAREDGYQREVLGIKQTGTSQSAAVFTGKLAASGN